MAYVLLASLLVALGWGLKSVMSIPHPGGLIIIISGIVVLVGSLFWVVVTLHALDLLVAFRRSDRRYLAGFFSSLRPRMRELLIALPVTGLALLATYGAVGAKGTMVAALDVPFYALSIAAVLSASPTQGKTFPRWRMGVTLSAIYIALYSVTTGLHAVIATRPTLASTAPWLGVTSAMAAVAIYVSATKFRSSIEQGRALTSPVLEELGGKFPGTQAPPPKPGDKAVRQSRDPMRSPPPRKPLQYGRRKPGRRR